MRELRKETARRFPDWTVLQIGAEQGTFMTLLSQLIAPRRAVEVGTFTGYSSICLARGLAPTAAACCAATSTRTGPPWPGSTGRRQAWPTGSSCGSRRPLETLHSLPPDASLDLAFIDADKTGYATYWDEIVPRTRAGGIILVDNTFLHGRIFDSDPDPDARAVRDFNEHALADNRVELAMLSVGDGLTFARKK